MIAALIAVACVLGALVLVAGISLSLRAQDAPAVHEASISQVLTLADHHQLKSATIAGDDVTVVTTSNVQYHATKEAGQPLTQYLRDDGVDVSVTQTSGGTPGWVQILTDVVLFGGLLVLLVLLMRRSNSALQRVAAERAVQRCGGRRGGQGRAARDRPLPQVS
jgi:hypothetical protein